MYVKRSSTPARCLGQALNAIEDLKARHVIASVPEPLLADWNAYELQPHQASELVLSVHRIDASGQPGKQIVQIDIA